MTRDKQLITKGRAEQISRHPDRYMGIGATGVHDHITTINLSDVPEDVIQEYLAHSAHSAKGNSIFDIFDMIKGRNGLYSLADLSPTLKQHFKHVVFRGVKYIDRNRGGNK